MNYTFWAIWSCLLVIVFITLLWNMQIFKLIDFPENQSTSSMTNENILFQLLIEENVNLRLEIEKYKGEIEKLLNESKQKFGHFSRDHEKIRISLTSNMKELPFFIKGKLNKLVNKVYKNGLNNTNVTHQVSQLFDGTRAEITEMCNAIRLDVDKLSEVDNAAIWRGNQLKAVTDKIQNKIRSLQFPQDCKTAKKLQCDFDLLCGYGCQIQHIINCLIIAYGTNRTLLPVLDKWHYSPNGWSEFFLPITSCTMADIGNRMSSNDSDPELWHITSLRETIPLVPPAFPKEFADQLIHLHTDPSLLWISQFLKFLKFQPKIQDYLNAEEKSMNFTEHTIGIHIRRTDKLLTDTFLFTVEQYMEHARDWFDFQSLKHQSISKKIVLITDEPSVIDEIIDKYPEYEFVYDRSHSVRAKFNRTSAATSLYDILADVHLLSKCSYIICTLSSNICRLAYEYGLLDFDKNGDFTNNLISLDNIYYFWGQQRRLQVAIFNHIPDLENGEIELKIGDILEVKLPYLFVKNKLEGFIEGTNHRTNKIGFYPLFKVQEKWLIADFP